MPKVVDFRHRWSGHSKFYKKWILGKMDFSPSGVAGNPPLHFLLNCLIRKKSLRRRGHAWEKWMVNSISLQTMKFFRNNFSNMQHDCWCWRVYYFWEPGTWPFQSQSICKKLANASLGILFLVSAHPLLDLNLR